MVSVISAIRTRPSGGQMQILLDHDENAHELLEVVPWVATDVADTEEHSELLETAHAASAP